MPEVKIENLKIGYLNKKTEIIVLNNFSATFENKKFSVILGESGCGKTTLLKTIIGFFNYEGKIFFDGVNIENTKVQDRDVAYVSQSYALYPHLTVFDNIAFPLKLLHAERLEIIERVTEMAKRLGIEDTLTRKPKVLSGGQLQRVAIARALIKKPSLLLLDEPLSNLDAISAAEIRRLLKSLVKEFGLTVIYVTHSVENAVALADKIFIIRDGEIKFSGDSNKLLKTKDPIVLAYKKTKQPQQND